MKYAIISDIHSNLEALTAVLREIDSKGVDEVISIGDIVGYNANPNECIEIIRGRKIRALMGNHDLTACKMEDLHDFTPIAKKGVLWTREELTRDNLNFLKSLPTKLFLDGGKALAVHGSIKDLHTYILNPLDAVDSFRTMDNDPDLPPVCFFGHTHVKIAYLYLNGNIMTSCDDEFYIDKRELYLVNPGSVGQPRDMDNRAAFLIYDTTKNNICFFRVEYDIDSCYEKILKAGLPIELAARLKVGR
ncbi:MAG: metallophosphoesterase family protein [Thermodesulfobacteriota bacterium]